MTTTHPFGPAELDSLAEAHPTLRMIDVRTPAEFASGHIIGSYNVPLPDLAEHQRELTSSKSGPVVVICRSGRRADNASKQLVAAGLTDVRVLDGGIDGWRASGYPLIELDGEPGWGLERQVRLLAGAIVAASIAASIWWGRARFVAGAMGAGLVVAAATDTCAMGNLLARLPHNRARTNRCDLSSLVSTLTSNLADDAERAL